METDLTIAEAREILQMPGYDAYGTLRLYCVFPAESIYSGQIESIKSEYYLDKYSNEHGFARLYSKINNGSVPVARA